MSERSITVNLQYEVDEKTGDMRIVQKEATMTTPVNIPAWLCPDKSAGSRFLFQASYFYFDSPPTSRAVNFQSQTKGESMNETTERAEVVPVECRCPCHQR